MRPLRKHLRAGRLQAEGLVHDLGAASERGNDLMPVDQFCRSALVVARQQRDRLHRHAMSRQQRHERMPQLPRHPLTAKPGCLGAHPELPPHIVMIQRRIRRVLLDPEQVSADPRSRRRRTLHPDQRALPIPTWRSSRPSTPTASS